MIYIYLKKLNLLTEKDFYFTEGNSVSYQNLIKNIKANLDKTDQIKDK